MLQSWLFSVHIMDRKEKKHKSHHKSKKEKKEKHKKEKEKDAKKWVLYHSIVLVQHCLSVANVVYRKETHERYGLTGAEQI